MKTLVRFLQFSLSGLPGFLLALAANAALVQVWHWPKPAAYLPVVWIQMTMGFLMCRYLVFSDTGATLPFFSAYGQFAASMATIRVADWLMYTACVEFLHCPYLLAQIFCSCLFIGVKFFSAKLIFRATNE